MARSPISSRAHWSKYIFKVASEFLKPDYSCRVFHDDGKRRMFLLKIIWLYTTYHDFGFGVFINFGCTKAGIMFA